MIFDYRGLMAEEYIDAGHWQASSVAARATRHMEALALKSADGVVTLTDALWQAMQTWPSVDPESIAHETIPCCIDLEKFDFNERQRIARRQELGTSDRFVLVYSGSIGGWYMTSEMAAFFVTLKKERPDAFFLWLTQGDRSIVDQAMTMAGLQPKDYSVKSVAPVDVPSWLNAADAGIAFYRPGTSRLGTSPVKINEYLACGLPVVVNFGVGDVNELIASHGVGALVQDFTESSYSSAAGAITNCTDSRVRAREVAEKLFDVRRVGVDRYARLYERVLMNYN
jgi:glycosyltransferase involved in cell wall biosynthesis